MKEQTYRIAHLRLTPGDPRFVCGVAVKPHAKQEKTPTQLPRCKRCLKIAANAFRN